MTRRHEHVRSDRHAVRRVLLAARNALEFDVAERRMTRERVDDEQSSAADVREPALQVQKSRDAAHFDEDRLEPFARENARELPCTVRIRALRDPDEPALARVTD